MWIFNLILWLFWMGNPAFYGELIDAGQTCWYYRPIAEEAPSSPAPPCPYLAAAPLQP